MSATLTPEDLAAIEAIVRRVVGAGAANAPAPAWLPRRLSVDEFAHCIQVTSECARRYCRANRRGIRTKKLAFNESGKKWLIDITALELFGVSQALAAARLAQLNEQPPSAV